MISPSYPYNIPYKKNYNYKPSQKSNQNKTPKFSSNQNTNRYNKIQPRKINNYYKNYEESKENQKITKKSVNQEIPNSKRTLIPAYQPLNTKDKIHHKATSFYSNKFNTNSVGPDFIPNEEPKIMNPRKSAYKILQESNPPLNIRQLKPNLLHQKYIETSQINNIPGPDIMKRVESDAKYNEDKRNKLKNKIKNLNNNNDNFSNNRKNKNSYQLRNKDIESFQRKVYRDYNSNIACLPGVTINDKEKIKTLVATNNKKNESQFTLGINNNNEISNENINYNNIRNKYDYTKKNYNYNKSNLIPRPKSFSGKRIIRDRNKESNNYNMKIADKIISAKWNNSYMNESENYAKIDTKRKYSKDKNKSQIIFG